MYSSEEREEWAKQPIWSEDIHREKPEKQKKRIPLIQTHAFTKGGQYDHTRNKN